MRNSYEMPEVLELGRTNEEILGSKPPEDIDTILGVGFRRQPLPDDIDESEERG